MSVMHERRTGDRKSKHTVFPHNIQSEPPSATRAQRVGNPHVSHHIDYETCPKPTLLTQHKCQCIRVLYSDSLFTQPLIQFDICRGNIGHKFRQASIKKYTFSI